MAQLVQASIASFGTRPETLFSMMDEESGAILVSKATALQLKRRAGAIVITDDPGIIDRDALFQMADLGAAVAAYGEVQAGGKARLDYAQGLERCRPSVESDGYDASGPKWRINPGITAGQAAVLVTCWYVRGVGQHVGQAMAMMDDLAAILSGRVVSV